MVSSRLFLNIIYAILRGTSRLFCSVEQLLQITVPEQLRAALGSCFSDCSITLCSGYRIFRAEQFRAEQTELALDLTVKEYRLCVLIILLDHYIKISMCYWNALRLELW